MFCGVVGEDGLGEEVTVVVFGWLAPDTVAVDEVGVDDGVEGLFGVKVGLAGFDGVKAGPEGRVGLKVGPEGFDGVNEGPEVTGFTSSLGAEATRM